jgi:hypothetical protein
VIFVGLSMSPMFADDEAVKMAPRLLFGARASGLRWLFGDNESILTFDEKKIQPNISIIFLGMLSVILNAEKAEPKLTFSFYIDEKPIQFQNKEEKKIVEKFTDPVIKIIEGKEIEFTYSGMRFQYPAYFAFEADVESDDYKCWTLSGNDVKIMIFSVRAKFTPDDFVNGMKEQFQDSKIPDVSRMLGATKFTGKRIDIKVADTQKFTDSFLIKSGTHYKMLAV